MACNNVIDNVNRIHYKCIEKTYCTIEIGNYISYGIKAMLGDEVLQEIEDISVSKESVKELVNLINKHELSILHLRDIVDDFIS